MELHAIAALRGENDQRTEVHAELRLLGETGRTRLDLAVIGDVRAPGVGAWVPGDLQTGPAYHTFAVLDGDLPGNLEAFSRRIQGEIRDTLALRLRRLLPPVDGKTEVWFYLVTKVAEAGQAIPLRQLAGELLYELPAATPVAIPEPSIVAIGTELRDLIRGEVLKILTPSATVPPAPDPRRVKIADEAALRMYKAGRLPLRQDQLQRLCNRLGVPVPPAP